MGDKIYIALGGNVPSKVGLPESTMLCALNRLPTHCIIVTVVSSFYRTPAWPDPSAPAFVNAAAQIETDLPPDALLHTLHAIEADYGRVRLVPNGPRTLDIDLIDYRGLVVDGDVILPHPRISSRAFVLIPLREIAPHWRHPVSGRSIADLCEALPQNDLAAIEMLTK